LVGIMVAVKITPPEDEGDPFTVQAETVGDLKREIKKWGMHEKLWWLHQWGRVLLLDDDNARVLDVLSELGLHSLQLTKKKQQPHKDGKSTTNHIWTDKTRFLVTGRRTDFKVLKDEEWRDDFILKLNRGLIWTDKFGIVTNLFRGEGGSVQIQFAVYKVSGDGKIRIKTAADRQNTEVYLMKNGQEERLYPSDQKRWDTAEIINPREQRELEIEYMRTVTQLATAAAGAIIPII